MAVSWMYFSPAELTEIHLLAGGTVNLGAMLNLVMISGPNQTGDAFHDPGSTLIFRPMLKNAGGPGGSVVNRGITVNTTTGVVTLANPLLAGFKRNFIVEAEVTQVAVGANPAPPPLRAFVRIHVHRSISSIWLSPASLRVMRRQPVTHDQFTNRRFALYAAFDDGIVGDITNHMSILGFTWPDGGVGNIMIPAGIAVGDHMPVTATVGTLSDTKEVVVVGTWADDPTLKADLVPGGAVESHASPSTANIIFLAEGFALGQDQEFHTFVNGLVAYMNDPVSAPYGLLKPNIAFWSVFLGRAEGGVSTGGEVYPVSESAGTFTMRYVPHPERPRDDYSADQPWTLPELLYMVGLPMPGDAEGAGRTDDAIIAEWRDLLPADPEPHLGRNQFLFWNTDRGLLDDWRALATRCMIDDVDSALGLRAGSPAPDDFAGSLSLDVTRMVREGAVGIDGLFSGLVSNAGTNLAGVWDPVDDKAPFSWSMVCIVSSSYGRAGNETGNGFFHLNQHAMFGGMRATRVAGNRFRLVPTAPLSVPTADHGRTFVHELTHSFQIGDEYGEYDAIAPETAAEMDLFNANLQVESSTMRDDPGNGLKIFGDEIKWSWHRIALAAEISGPITATGVTLVIPVQETQGARFAVGMEVIIRGRKRGDALRKRPDLSVPLSVVDVQDNQLKVTGSILTYRYAGTQIDVDGVPAAFHEGCVIYAPLPSPAGITDSFLELVAFNIKQFITAQHLPLTKFPDQRDDNPVQVPVLDGVSLPDCFNRNRPRVVGLYSGGERYHRGVFHPTGHCLMRESHTDGRELCMVCRYLLVDALDPSKHGEVDATFTSVYPMRF